MREIIYFISGGVIALFDHPLELLPMVFAINILCMFGIYFYFYREEDTKSNKGEKQ